MQLNITGHHIDLTDALKDYVKSKLQKLERHIESISNVQVTLSVSKQAHIAESTLHIAGADIHGHAENSDMYAAIDQLIDKLDRQILKHKEKNVDRAHGAASR
jgi:ribosome hibernation promoting factor